MNPREFKVDLIVDADSEPPAPYEVTRANQSDRIDPTRIVEKPDEEHEDLVQETESFCGNKGNDSDDHENHPAIAIRPLLRG